MYEAAVLSEILTGIGVVFYVGMVLCATVCFTEYIWNYLQGEEDIELDSFSLSWAIVLAFIASGFLLLGILQDIGVLLPMFTTMLVILVCISIRKYNLNKQSQLKLDRLSALKELSKLDQELDLDYGIISIKKGYNYDRRL